MFVLSFLSCCFAIQTVSVLLCLTSNSRWNVLGGPLPPARHTQHNQMAHLARVRPGSRFLVTGGQGFVGAYVAKNLISKNVGFRVQGAMSLSDIFSYDKT